MGIGQAGARSRVVRRLMIVAVVSAGLVVASGVAAGADEVPGFRTDTGAPGVFLGADDVPGVGNLGDAGAGDTGAFTFGTTPLTTPLATAAASEPSLAGDVAAQPADKGGKEVAGKVPMGHCLLFGRALCPPALSLLPGTVNSVYYDPSLPSPARDAAQWAASLISDRTVVKLVPTTSSRNADVVVRMRPLDGAVDERGYAPR